MGGGGGSAHGPLSHLELPFFPSLLNNLPGRQSFGILKIRDWFKNGVFGGTVPLPQMIHGSAPCNLRIDNSWRSMISKF